MLDFSKQNWERMDYLKERDLITIFAFEQILQNEFSSYFYSKDLTFLRRV